MASQDSGGVPNSPLDLPPVQARGSVDTAVLAPLFEPFQLKGVTLRNRFVMPAMQRNCCIDGAPSPEFSDYYRRRAEGGCALIITEGAAIDHPSATYHDCVLRMEPDKMPAWKRYVDDVKSADSAFLVQLFHEGAIRQEGKGPYPGQATLSPSGLYKAGYPSGRAATLEELVDIKRAYVKAALDAQSVGADGVEVHSAHGYFLYQFLWEETNRRDDIYGGADIVSRARYLSEIVRDIREATGPDFIIAVKLSQWAEVNYDARIFGSPQDLKGVMDVLNGVGIDMFTASTRAFYAPEWPGSDMGLAGWMKQFTDKPVVTIGSVGLDATVASNFMAYADAHPDFGTLPMLVDRLGRGDFDLIAVGRSVYADSHWVDKVHRGAFDAIIPFQRRMLAVLGIEDGDGYIQNPAAFNSAEKYRDEAPA